MIDKNGKIFGIINIVDLAVLLILVLFVGAVGYKVIGSKNTGNIIGTKTEDKEVVVTVLARLKPESVANSLKEGDKLVAKNNWTNGVIESVEYTEADYSVPTDKGELVLDKHPMHKDVKVTLRFKTDVSGPIISFAGQEVRIGADYWVKTQTVEVQGLITNIDVK